MHTKPKPTAIGSKLQIDAVIIQLDKFGSVPEGAAPATEGDGFPQRPIFETAELSTSRRNPMRLLAAPHANSFNLWCDISPASLRGARRKNRDGISFGHRKRKSGMCLIAAD